MRFWPGEPIPAAIENGKHRLTGIIGNLSETGCLLLGHEYAGYDFHDNEKITFEFLCGNTLIKESGVVVRKNNKSVGVRFKKHLSQTTVKKTVGNNAGAVRLADNSITVFGHLGAGAYIEANRLLKKTGKSMVDLSQCDSANSVADTYLVKLLSRGALLRNCQQKIKQIAVDKRICDKCSTCQPAPPQDHLSTEKKNGGWPRPF